MAYNVILCYLKRSFFIAVLLFSPSVPTYLLERHYYMWKEEEIAESEEKEKEAKKLREMKMKMWHEPASSAESSNVCILSLIFIGVPLFEVVYHSSRILC